MNTRQHQAGLRDTVPYGAFYAAVYLPIACTLTFLSLWLRDKGLSELHIGLLMAAGAVPRLIANPLAGHIADRTGNTKAVLLATSTLSLIASCVFFVVDGPLGASIAFILVTLFSVTLLPLGEAITIQGMKQKGIDYGSVRRWGSVSIIIMSLLVGFLVQYFSISVFPFLLFLSYFFLLIIVASVPNPIQGHSVRENFPQENGALHRGLFFSLIATAGLSQATHAPFNTYATLYWIDNGISPFTASLLWAAGICSEVVGFSIMSRLSRSIPPMPMILLGALAAALRWAALAMDASLPTAVVVQAVQGISLAATQTGAARYIASNFPESVTARITGLYAMISMGLLQSIILLLASYTYSPQGHHFAVTASAAVVAALFSLAYLTRK